MMHIFHNGIGKPLFGQVEALEGGGGTFSPLDISGLKLWLDASDTGTITQAGGYVSQWDDKSENSYHLVQATASAQPVTGSRTINSLNVLDFDGLDYLQNTADIANIFSTTGTWFVVGEADTSELNVIMYVNDSPDENGSYPYNSGGGTNILEVELKRDTSKKGVFFYQDGGAGIAAATNAFTDAQQIQFASFEPSAALLTGNNSGETDTGASTPSSQTYTAARFRIGAHGSETNTDRWLNGAVAEILIYDRVLNNSEINTLGQHLASKWGLLWTNI